VPGVENFLESVVASSSGDVWALGYHGYVGAREDALIIRLRH